MSQYFVINKGAMWRICKRSTGQPLAFRRFYSEALQLARALDERGETAVLGRPVQAA